MAITDPVEMKKVEKLYDQYRKLLMKVANDIIHDWHLSEDAVNSTFENILKKLDKIDVESETKIKNYLSLVCKNVSINMKAKKPMVYIEDIGDLEDVRMSSDPVEFIINKEMIAEVKRDLKELPANWYFSIMFKLYGNTYKEIANLLRSKENTVKSWLKKAVKYLRKKREMRDRRDF